MTTLYELSAKLEELNSTIDNLDGVVIPAELADWLSDGAFRKAGSQEAAD